MSKWEEGEDNDLIECAKYNWKIYYFKVEHVKLSIKKKNYVRKKRKKKNLMRIKIKMRNKRSIIHRRTKRGIVLRALPSQESIKSLMNPYTVYAPNSLMKRDMTKMPLSFLRNWEIEYGRFNAIRTSLVMDCFSLFFLTWKSK